MSLITQQTFEELSNIESPNCISIYVPTEREGENKESKIRLKNHIQRIEKKLAENNVQGEKIQKYLAPVTKLLNDPSLWRELSDGLAIFLSKDKFAYTTLPIHFNDYSVVSNHFYLLPLLPVFNGDGRFFVLSLSAKKVRFFEGTRDFIEEIDLSDLIPENVLDAAGYDVEQKSLQHRSQQTGTDGNAMYHGHGDGKNDKKNELTKFLREINNGINEYLKGYNAPLVIASVDYLFAMYKGLNNYPNLYGDNISGNFDEAKMGGIHDEAWNLLKDYFDKNKEESKAVFHEKVNAEKASSNLRDIIPAAMYGNIDTLFVRKNSRLWGEFIEENENILVHEEKQKNDDCLLDLSAKSTFLQGGKVYIVDQEELPEKNSVINAIFRY